MIDGVAVLVELLVVVLVRLEELKPNQGKVHSGKFW